jgi:hypothetical protein
VLSSRITYSRNDSVRERNVSIVEKTLVQGLAARVIG